MDTEAANQDAQGVENTTRLVEALKAEAAYFLVEDGQRCCLVVFEMEDPAQIPVICEPLFLGKGEGGPDPLHDPRGFDDRLRAVSKRAGRVRRTERDPWARPALRRVSDPPAGRRASRSVPDDMEHGRRIGSLATVAHPGRAGAAVSAAPSRILISGASVAGPVLAYWLRRWGFEPTVVERTDDLRLGVGGHAVDLFGPAMRIIGWMNLGPAVRDAKTRTDTVSLVRPGKRPVTADMEWLTAGVSDDHVEILRGDLARIVYGASRDEVEYILGDSIASLTDHDDHVEVSFERTAPRTFDAVVGADGLHSITRRLTFGDEQQFLHFLGGYFAVFSVANYLQLERRMLSYAEPGRIAAVYPVWGSDQLRVVLLFRTPRELDYDRHDRAAQIRLLQDMYSGGAWEVPRLLSQLEHAEDLYLDSISQVRMNTWTKGPITLVGDAGYSPGPAVGGGTSLAVMGAYALAAEMAAAAPDQAAGFAAYEQAIRPAVQASTSIARAVLHMIPNSSPQVWAMAQAMRILPRLPAAARRWLTTLAGNPAAMLDSARIRDPASLH